MASLILLIVLAVYCIDNGTPAVNEKNNSREVDSNCQCLPAFYRVLECADKSCILPKQKNPFPE